MSADPTQEFCYRSFTWGQVVASVIWLAILGSHIWRLESQIKTTERFAEKMGYGKYVTTKDGDVWFKWKIAVPE